MLGVIEKRKLTIRSNWAKAYELPDGGLTSSYSDARWAMRVRIDPDPQEVKSAVRELMDIRTENEKRRPTPARLNAAWDLLDLGVLPSPLRGTLLEADRIDDRTWHSLRQLSARFEPRGHLVNTWSILLTDGDENEVELPIEYDHENVINRDYPRKAVGEIVHALTTDGWSVQRLESVFDEYEGDLVERGAELWR